MRMQNLAVMQLKSETLCIATIVAYSNNRNIRVSGYILQKIRQSWHYVWTIPGASLTLYLIIK